MGHLGVQKVRPGEKGMDVLWVKIGHLYDQDGAAQRSFSI